MPIGKGEESRLAAVAAVEVARLVGVWLEWKGGLLEIPDTVLYAEVQNGWFRG